MKVFNVKAFAHFGIAFVFLILAHFTKEIFHISDSWTALIFALQIPVHIGLFCTKLADLNKTNVPVYYEFKNGAHIFNCNERAWSLQAINAIDLLKYNFKSPYILMNRQDLFDAVEKEQARK